MMNQNEVNNEQLSIDWLVEALGSIVDPSTDNQKRLQLDSTISSVISSDQAVQLLRAFSTISNRIDIRSEIRVQALVLLRTLALRPTPSSSVWVNSIKPDQQNSIIHSLIQSLVSSSTIPPPQQSASSSSVHTQQQPDWIVQLGHAISNLAKHSQQIQFTSEPWSIALRPLVVYHLLPDHPSNPSSHSPDPILQTTLLNILTSVPGLFCSSESELEAILSASLESEHFPLRLAALQSICVSELDSSQAFSDLVFRSILVHLPYHQVQSEVEAALDHLIEFLTFNDVNDLSPWIKVFIEIGCVRTNPSSIRSSALECLVTLIESSPPLPGQLNPDIPWLEAVMGFLIGLMMEITEDSEWSMRIDSEDDEDADEIYIQGEQALDRVLQTIMNLNTNLESLALNLFFSKAQEFGATTDWRLKHAYLSGLAVIVPISKSTTAQNSNFDHQILEVLRLGFQDPHPRVVYASLYALAQLSENLVMIIRKNQNCLNQVMSYLINSLDMKDQPRIQNFTAKALNDLLISFQELQQPQQQAPPEQQQQRTENGALANPTSLSSGLNVGNQRMRIELDGIAFESLLIRLIGLGLKVESLNSFDGLVCIGSLFGSVSRSIGLNFYEAVINRFDKVYEEIEIHKKSLDMNESKKDEGVEFEERRLLIERVECKFFEALSEFASNVGEDRFDVDSSKWANRLVQAINSTSPESSLVNLNHLIKLSNGIKVENFLKSGYFEFVLNENILKILRSKPDISISALIDQDHQFDDCQWESVLIGDQTFGIKSNDLESKESAAESLLALAHRFGAWMIPYCDRIVEAVVPLLKFYFSDEVREACMALLPVLLKSAKASGMKTEQVSTISTSFCNSISEALSCEPADSGNLSSSLLGAWADCFNQAAPSPEEVDRMIELSQARLEILINNHEDRNFQDYDGYGDDDDEEEEEDNLGKTLARLSRVLRILISARPNWNWRSLMIKVVEWVTGRGSDQQQLGGTAIGQEGQAGLSGDARPTKLSIGLKRLGFRLVGAFVSVESNNFGEELIGRLGREVLLGFEDRDDCLRGLAPFIIGLCAEKVGDDSKLIYKELIKSSIGKLVEGLERRERDEVERSKIEAVKMARENCVSALAKIIRNSIEGVIDKEAELNLVLEKWLEALPIEIDIEEVEPTYGLLLELIARGHESVDPTKVPISKVSRIIDGMISVIENPKINPDNRSSISIGLKSYLFQLPENVRSQISI